MLKNITLSAEAHLLKKARIKAQQEHSTLNARFRQWLENYTCRITNLGEYQQLMDDLSYAKPIKTYSRDELNAR